MGSRERGGLFPATTPTGGGKQPFTAWTPESPWAGSRRSSPGNPARKGCTPGNGSSASARDAAVAGARAREPGVRQPSVRPRSGTSRCSGPGRRYGIPRDEVLATGPATELCRSAAEGGTVSEVAPWQRLLRDALAVLALSAEEQVRVNGPGCVTC